MIYTEDEAACLEYNGFEMHNVTTITDLHKKYVLGRYKGKPIFKVVTLADAERLADAFLHKFTQRFN